MTPQIVSITIGLYFTALLVIGYFTGKGLTQDTFFTANRNASWYLVAFGMIGASLSGVTFISVPGEVANSNFHYFQVVIGYTLGYLVIGTILLPLYYRLNLVSIYGYLESRFGYFSYKTGAVFFIISRVIGASFRLFLVATVLHLALFQSLNVPFWATVSVTILLIYVYTFNGGIKTVIWTDTLQTFFMLSAAIAILIIIFRQMDWTLVEGVQKISQDPRSDIFNWDWRSRNNFIKQFASGAFIAIVMTGLDQDMMQKNLTCRTLGESQKNMFWFTIVLVFVNLIFLGLGVTLYLFADSKGIMVLERTDLLFPLIALDHLPVTTGILFLLGIIAAAYSSADSALTALTTSFCYDIISFKRFEEKKQTRLRRWIHIGFAVVILMTILIFNTATDSSVINAIFRAAGYTYGPLLGLFSFGYFTNYMLKDRWVPLVTVVCPLLTYVINANSEWLFNGYRFGFEILILNGLLTFIGLWIIKKR